MAKKTKVVDTCCAPVGGYKPRLYLDLQDQDVSKVKGLTIGEEAEFTVKGKVVGLSQRERKEGEKTVKTGSIDLESYTVGVMGEESNEFKKMADDE